ncbi:hypothetical protein ON010_g17254 [Phytophthora cinnamomi]|nr:hypothetical protein ON010_g17254 [Phytophthora cinnamomi]
MRATLGVTTRGKIESGLAEEQQNDWVGAARNNLGSSPSRGSISDTSSSSSSTSSDSGSGSSTVGVRVSTIIDFGSSSSDHVCSIKGLAVANGSGAVIYRMTDDAKPILYSGGVDETGNTDGPVLDARYSGPNSLTSSSSGDLYVTPAGVVSTFATLTKPTGIPVDSSDNIYVTDSSRMLQFTPTGVITVLAGPKTSGYEDGVGTSVNLTTYSL